MSKEIEDIQKEYEINQDTSKNIENGKKINSKKLIKHEVEKKRMIQKKGVLNKVISKKISNTKNYSSTDKEIQHSNEIKNDEKLTNVYNDIMPNSQKIDKVNVTNDDDKFIFKVPNTVPKKDTKLRFNQISMRKRTDSISNSPSFQTTSGSSREILKQIAAKAAKAKIQRKRNNSSISEHHSSIEKRQDVIVTTFDEFLPYSSDNLSNDEIITEIKDIEPTN
ncbi:Hypothetical protein SRAE_X000104300 [Strongyloides ratti]|uniref:Uncharacterized protein n=1 Tax=Strongyloides ratti TaxID=34506 RepID=A0A090KVM9_STRRB|nr:Hypothetical protein SRAE_X000104300 [Strongyloides ratti]CEF59292.1 Hypothetical protein SRAE_X000104300 [Strongyloides ratti]